MSDEKRREELKAIINEQLDKLSIEDLESVAGGKIVKNDDGTYSVYDKKVAPIPKMVILLSGSTVATPM